MPRKSWATQADWDAEYRVGLETDGFVSAGVGARAEVKLHFVRSMRQSATQQIADHYEGHLGPAAFNRRFVIVGGGFGWAAQELLIRGFTNIVVVETSAYVQAEKGNTDEAEVRAAISAVGLDPDAGRGAALLERGSPAASRNPRGAGIVIVNADISTSAGRTAVRNALVPSGNPQIVISEDVATSLDDAEVVALDADMSAWGGQQTVVHMVSALPPGTVGVPPRYNPPFNWKTLVAWKALLPDPTWIDVTTGDIL